MDATDRWFRVVVLAVFLFIIALVLREALGDEIGELRDEISALRAEIECRNQPDDCDVARLLVALRRGR